MTSFEVSALGRNLDRAIDWWRAYLAEHLAWLVDWLNLPQNRTTWRRKHAPNIVTIGRGVVAILLLAVLFRFGHNYAVRAICITLLGIDLMFDGVDGMLAEKLDRQTKTGAVLDVVVDHFIILLGISVYVIQTAWPHATRLQQITIFCSVGFFLAFFALTMVISIFREKQYVRIGQPVGSLPLGKLKFVWACVGVGITLYLPVGPLMPMWLAWAALMPAAVLSSMSMDEYLDDFHRVRLL
jgi:phosphatidylglycerophosphate synthase